MTEPHEELNDDDLMKIIEELVTPKEIRWTIMFNIDDKAGATLRFTTSLNVTRPEAMRVARAILRKSEDWTITYAEGRKR